VCLCVVGAFFFLTLCKCTFEKETHTSCTALSYSNGAGNERGEEGGGQVRKQLYLIFFLYTCIFGLMVEYVLLFHCYFGSMTDPL
jgi:hypothetical protein